MKLKSGLEFKTIEREEWKDFIDTLDADEEMNYCWMKRKKTSIEPIIDDETYER
jgi:hypothetical protein